MSVAETDPPARIHDRGYRPYDGPFGSVGSRFWVIAANELRQAAKSKWFRKLLWAAFFPLGVFGVLVIVRSRMEMLAGALRIWPDFVEVQVFFGMLAIFFTGRRAVGEDLRTGALTIYFSRPVDFFQYLLGKWLAIGLAAAGMLVGPGLLLVVFHLVADPGTGLLLSLRWALGLVALGALFGLAGGWTMLAISSLTGRGRAAGIVWVVLFFLSAAAGAALASATGIEGLSALGMATALSQLAEVLFGLRPAGVECLWWTAGLLGWALAGALVVIVRLRGWRNA